jgi:hypothetical protein
VPPHGEAEELLEKAAPGTVRDVGQDVGGVEADDLYLCAVFLAEVGDDGLGAEQRPVDVHELVPDIVE